MVNLRSEMMLQELRFHLHPCVYRSIDAACSNVLCLGERVVDEGISLWPWAGVASRPRSLFPGCVVLRWRFC
jgi:hypothetical protein